MRAVLQNLVVVQLVKKFPMLWNSNLLSCPQELDTGPYRESIEFILHSINTYFVANFIQIFFYLTAKCNAVISPVSLCTEVLFFEF